MFRGIRGKQGSPADPIKAGAGDPTAGETLEECKALARYVSRHGDILGDDEDLWKAYDQLLDSIAKCGEKGGDDGVWVKLRMSYAKVTRHTNAAFAVNGRSVLDTHTAGTRGWSNYWLKGPGRPISVGLCLFVFALILQVLAGWAGRVHDPASLGGWAKSVYWITRDVSPLLLAATWGGIGSCIFLMKKLSDRLSSMAYERSRLKGDMSRIVVGSFLGVAAIEAIFSDYGEMLMMGEADFGPNLIALVAGLAIKPVYGMFEALAEGIASRIAGESETPRPSPPPPSGQRGELREAPQPGTPANNQHENTARNTE